MKKSACNHKAATLGMIVALCGWYTAAGQRVENSKFAPAGKVESATDKGAAHSTHDHASCFKAGFCIDVSKTELKLASNLGDRGATYNTEGQFPSVGEKKTNFRVWVKDNSSDKIKNMTKDVFRVTTLKEDTVHLDLKTYNVVEIDSMKGVEVVAYDTTGATPALRYMVILFGKEHTFELRGFANDAHEQALATFKSVSRTFRRWNGLGDADPE